MRSTLFTLCLGLAGAVAAQDKPVASPTYDAALAERLGADPRGMRRYVFVILKTGPKAELPKAERSKIFAGHMANLERLAAEGKLVLAGPFLDNQSHFEGLFVFNAKTVKEAEDLLVTDPAISAGALTYDAYLWYGSAALMEVTAIHNRIDKTSR
jgi:uncharacterized protein YciI